MMSYLSSIQKDTAFVKRYYNHADEIPSLCPGRARNELFPNFNPKIHQRMKLHLPVRLRASLIAAVIAITSGVYNAHANDISDTNITFTEVYNRTSGNTYTASQDISFQAIELTKGLHASFISGDTTLTAGRSLIFNNHFGANSTDLQPDQDKQYDGLLDIVADDIQVAGGGYRVVLEDVSIVDNVPVVGTRHTTVGGLSDLVVLNGDVSTLTDAEKKTLHAEELVNTPDVTARENSEVSMGALVGAGNFGAYGNGTDVSSVDADSIGTTDTRFGNVSAANTELNVAGDVYATTLVAVRSDVNLDGKADLIGLDLDKDSALTAKKDIDAGDTTGHVSVYGTVESTEGNVHLIHGNESDLDGLHEGSSVKAAEKVILEDIHAALAEVEGTKGVIIANGSLVEGSTITAGDSEAEPPVLADVIISDSTLREHTDAEGVVTKNTVNATDDVVIKDGAVVGGSEINAADSVIVTGVGSELSGKVDVNAGDKIVVKNDATLDIDGGEDSDASVDADTLAIRDAADDTATISNAGIALNTALISDEQTLVLNHDTGTIGAVVEANDGAPEVNGASLVVDEASELEIGTFYSQDSEDPTTAGHYFGNAEIKGGSTVDVTAPSYIKNYTESGKDTLTTFQDTTSIINASITGPAETVAQADSHIGNLSLADEGVLSLVNGTEGDAHGYIANITPGAEGTINVVDGYLNTPELDEEGLTLGLNGGIVTLRPVRASQGATVSSETHANPHVLVKAITDAADTGATETLGVSSIRTRVHQYIFDPGEEKTYDAYTYYYVARFNGTLDDGTEVTAGQLVALTDTPTTYALANGDIVNNGVIEAAFLSEHDSLLLDRLDQPTLDENEELQHIIGDNYTVLETGQICTYVDTITYYDGIYEGSERHRDGIASLTVKEDVSANKTHIRVYEIARRDGTADPDSGIIDIQGDLSGSEDIFIADKEISIGSMSGQDNLIVSLTDDVTIGDIGTETAKSSNNTIKGVNVTTGDIYGDLNELVAEENIQTGNITGDENSLSATNITTADITGDSNELTATEDISTYNITGDENILTAGGGIDSAVVKGNANQLSGNEEVCVDDVIGDDNVLTSQDGRVLVRGNVEGDTNTLDAYTDVQVYGSVIGDGNWLGAQTGEVDVDEDVIGDSNTLYAVEGDVHVRGDVNGDTNTLISVGGDSVDVFGTVSGEGNELSALSGSLFIGGIDGTNTIATAQKTAHVGALSGEGTQLLVYANGLSKDDTAISIDEFNAQDSSVGIATYTSDEYGYASGNGSIYIGTMSAVDGAVDEDACNYIYSPHSYVEIGALNGSNAYTEIDAATWIYMGYGSEGQDTASNMELYAQVLGVGSEEGLVLTDSTINTPQAIEGTSLTLNGDSVAATAGVYLDNLTLGDNAILRATEAQIADTLTLDGTRVTFDVTKVDTTTLVLRNNADLAASRVGAENLVVEDSTFALTSIDGIRSLKIDHSKGTVKQALDSLTGDVEIVNGSELYMTDNLGTEAAITVADSTVEVSNIKAGKGLNAESSTVTAKNTIDIQGGESAISNSVVAAKVVNVDGVVNAGEKALIMGHITGEGAINKTGGDALVIADADSNVAINVQDASTLKLANGTKVGAVDMGDAAATLQIGEANHVDTVQAAGLALSKNTALTLDMDMDKNTIDKVDAPVADLDGVTLTLNAMGDESKVADQSRVAFVSGKVTGAANEDVISNLQTLNAYADGNSIVFSKNFRSVADLNQNQRNTSAALADLEDHTEINGEMADVMDALHHTRSADETRAALDSLGGAGLAAVAKMATDDAHDHLQALRGNLKALSTGVDYRYENGERIPGIQSTAISAAVTGGTTSVQGGIAPKYQRDSIGALVSGVHAITHEWLGGISLGYTRSKGDCGPVDLKSDALYLDVAMIRRGRSVTHTATLGLGSYDFDTTRHVAVNAPGHGYAGTAKGSSSAMLVDLSYEAVATVIANEKHNFSGVFQADLVFGEFRGLTEKGMGNAGLRSEYDDVASLNFGIGGRYTYSFGPKNNPGYLAVEAMFVADAGDRDAVVKNTFIAGGQTFEEKGPDAGACGFRVNGGALIPVGQHWGVFGNVSSEFRSHQTSVSGSVGVKYAF